MKRFNRQKALDAVAENKENMWGEQENVLKDWRLVKNWIKDMVRREPVIMARVARARFGDLGSWIKAGSNNIKTACGCLVGTTALELVRERNHYELVDGYFVDPLKPKDDFGFSLGIEAYDLVPKLCKVHPAKVAMLQQQADVAGGAASDIGTHIGQKQAEALIKSEIRLQLKARKARIEARKKRYQREKRALVTA